MLARKDIMSYPIENSIIWHEDELPLTMQFDTLQFRVAFGPFAGTRPTKCLFSSPSLVPPKQPNPNLQDFFVFFFFPLLLFLNLNRSRALAALKSIFQHNAFCYLISRSSMKSCFTTILDRRKPSRCKRRPPKSIKNRRSQ